MTIRKTAVGLRAYCYLSCFFFNDFNAFDRVANLFTEAIFQDEEIEVWTNKVDAVVWVAADLMPECLPDIKAEAESGLDALVHALLPNYSGKEIFPHHKAQAAVHAMPNRV